jgi:hypothetical protein
VLVAAGASAADGALAHARRRPDSPEIARFVLQLAGDAAADCAERRRARRSLAFQGHRARGEFAPDEQARAVWAKHGSRRFAIRFRRLPISSSFLNYGAVRSTQTGELSHRIK